MQAVLFTLENKDRHTLWSSSKAQSLGDRSNIMLSLSEGGFRNFYKLGSKFYRI